MVEYFLCVGIAGSEEHDTTEDQGAYDHVFAVNYLGHFLLVYQLLPLLMRSAPSRIVSVTSMAHSFFKKPLLDIDSATKPFHENLVGYDASKLAMVLHTKHLNRLLGGMYPHAWFFTCIQTFLICECYNLVLRDAYIKHSRFDNHCITKFCHGKLLTSHCS